MNWKKDSPKRRCTYVADIISKGWACELELNFLLVYPTPPLVKIKRSV